MRAKLLRSWGSSLHGDPGALRARLGQGQRVLLPPPGPGRETRGARGRLRVHGSRRGSGPGPEQDEGALPVQGGRPAGRRRVRPRRGATPRSGNLLDSGRLPV
eukprot:14204243-Alexandrium_andersonii.AAC.1